MNSFCASDERSLLSLEMATDIGICNFQSWESLNSVAHLKPKNIREFSGIISEARCNVTYV